MATNKRAPWRESAFQARRFATSTIRGVVAIAVVSVLVAVMMSLLWVTSIWPVLLAALSGPIIVFCGMTLFYRVQMYWNRPFVVIGPPRYEGDCWYVPILQVRYKQPEAYVTMTLPAEVDVPLLGDVYARWRHIKSVAIPIAKGKSEELCLVRLRVSGNIVERFIRYQLEAENREARVADWDTTQTQAMQLMMQLAHPLPIQISVSSTTVSRGKPVERGFRLNGINLWVD